MDGVAEYWVGIRKYLGFEETFTKSKSLKNNLDYRIKNKAFANFQHITPSLQQHIFSNGKGKVINPTFPNKTLR